MPPILYEPAKHIYRVKCLVPADDNGKLERSSILIRAVLNIAGGPPQDVFADVALPVRPVLFSILNPRTGRSTGFADERPVVVISGSNLQGITGVFFGSEKAEVTGVSPDSITVRVPTHPGISRGQAAAVPIIFQTPGGQIPSGMIFTYLGEPLPPEEIVSPAGRPTRRPRE